MTTCNDVAVLVSLRAAAALDPAEAARLDAHLAGCARCRAEAEADAAVLALAKLPPPSEAEQRATADLPRRALAAFKQRDVRRSRVFRFSAVLALAAAALLAVLTPTLLGRPPAPPPGEVAAVVTPAEATVAATAAEAAAATWEAPDPEDLWDDSAVLDLDATPSSDTTDLADAVLAAADF